MTTEYYQRAEDAPKLEAAMAHPPRFPAGLIVGYAMRKDGIKAPRMQFFAKVPGGNPRCDPPEGMDVAEFLEKLATRHLCVMNSNGFLKVRGDDKFEAWKAKTWTPEMQQRHREKYNQPDLKTPEELAVIRKEALEKANATRAAKKAETEKLEKVQAAKVAQKKK